MAAHGRRAAPPHVRRFRKATFMSPQDVNVAFLNPRARGPGAD